MIITIDGPAGSGKSTVAEILAQKLSFIHFNSGALYRAITAHFYELGINIENTSPVTEFSDFDLKVRMIEDSQHVYINGVDYTPELRKNHISTLVAHIAKNKFCREKVDECQRDFCLHNNVVIEGRDTGSHVFPNADVKFYLDCSIKERARRRFLEERDKNPNITLLEIEQQLIERDRIDKTRDYAPLIIPNSAIIVDSTNLSITKVVDLMLKHVNSNLHSHQSK